MPSPQRIFRYLSTPQIEAIVQACAERQLNGAFTSLSGGGHSSSKQFADDANTLMEANYELSVRNNTVPPTRTTTDFSELLEHNTIVDV